MTEPYRITNIAASIREVGRQLDKVTTDLGMLSFVVNKSNHQLKVLLSDLKEIVNNAK